MRGARPATAAPSNKFYLPQEVFKLGLGHGPLLVYLYLIYRKNLRHGADKISCVIIGKAVGWCEKTVRTHLRTLADAGFINMERHGQTFSYTLCPILAKVHVGSLVNKDLIQAEETMIRWKDRRRCNGSLLYTVRPIEQILKEREKEFLTELKLAEAQHKWEQRCRECDSPHSAL